MTELEYSKVVHCPEDDGDVCIDDCCFCEHYEDTDTFNECIKCNHPKAGLE